MEKIIILFFMILMLATAAYANGDSSAEVQINTSVYPYKRDYDYKDVLVSRVLDEDNIELSDGRRIKLIGVEPQKTILGKSAAQNPKRLEYLEFLKQIIAGKKVNIELDDQHLDQQGRLLVYVYLNDGTFVNAELLRQGYGAPVIQYPNIRYRETFFRFYKEAQSNKRGLWRTAP